MRSKLASCRTKFSVLSEIPTELLAPICHDAKRFVMTSKTHLIMTSKVRPDVKKFVRKSKTPHDIKKFVMKSKSSKTRHNVKKLVITSQTRHDVKQICNEVKNDMTSKMFVMTSNSF